MATLGLESRVRRHARRVDEALATLAAGTAGDAAGAPVRHALASRGKRLRPALCLLAHEAAGGDPDDALGAAIGIELLHTFTLVHDDVMDAARERRGLPTVGALWGDAVAITAGDALFALAFDAFASVGRAPRVGPARALAVVRDAARVCADMARGQTMDLQLARRHDVAIAEQLEMTRLKTGVLLEFSLASGALLAGATEAEVRALSRFGAPLGVAFQIRDDLLDLVGDARRLGKPTGGDLRHGKRTLAVVHALATSPRAPRLREILDAPPAATGPAEVAEALAILEEGGSLAFAMDEAESLVAEARAALDTLPARTGACAEMRELAEYVLSRRE